jgi:hypothetical protein
LEVRESNFKLQKKKSFENSADPGIGKRATRKFQKSINAVKIYTKIHYNNGKIDGLNMEE